MSQYKPEPGMCPICWHDGEQIELPCIVHSSLLNPVEATGSEPIGEICCTCGQEGTFTGLRWIHKEPAHHEFTLSQSTYHDLRTSLRGEAAGGVPPYWVDFSRPEMPILRMPIGCRSAETSEVYFQKTIAALQARIAALTEAKKESQ